MANKHIKQTKRCLTPLAAREVQTKTTMKYQFPCIRMALVKNKDNEKCRQELRNENPHTLLVGMERCRSHYRKPSDESSSS